MPLDPIEVTLTDGQKLEVLKRYHHRYVDELEKLDHELRAFKTEVAEFEFVVQYLGEQPEVLELKDHAEKIEKLEQRRKHVGMLLDRLQQVLPKQSGDQPATFQRF